MDVLAVARPATGIARFVKDPFPGLSHGTGAVLALVGLLCLLGTARSGTAAVVGAGMYGVCLVLLYAASCCAHSLRGTPRFERLLDRLDYSAIFLLIAGTYTPVCLTTLRGPWGWSMLGVQWGLAALGTIMVMLVGPRKVWVALYLPMGWAVLTVIGPLSSRMDATALACLVAGGLVYSVGAVVFLTRRPRLWPGRFDSHDLWHTLVLVASGLHFATVWRITAA